MLVLVLAPMGCDDDGGRGGPGDAAWSDADALGARDGSWDVAPPDEASLPPGHDAGCSPDEQANAIDGGGRPVSGLRLYEAAVFQTVKIPVMNRLTELTERMADVVAYRPALFRAYVVPLPGFRPRPVRARLTLVRPPAGDSGAEVTEAFEHTTTVSTESNDRALESTFNFDLPASSVRPGTRYSLELMEASACWGNAEPDGARFPEGGTASLGVRDVGGVRVKLVPLHHRTGGGVLAPDTSPEQIDLYRRTLMKLFPIVRAEITVRDEAVETSFGTMEGLLTQVAALREADGSDRDETYYGLVRFTETYDDYCAVSCELGASAIGQTPEAGLPGGGAAVGVGYRDPRTAFTFAHELGHVYGRPHTPCGVDGDPEFPYRGGGIGTWGYDGLEGTLVDPAIFKDVMGYCEPYWISDYVYGHLQRFIAEVNRRGMQP